LGEKRNRAAYRDDDKGQSRQRLLSRDD
jgi:hypothetical protein